MSSSLKIAWQCGNPLSGWSKMHFINFCNLTTKALVKESWVQKLLWSTSYRCFQPTLWAFDDSLRDYLSDSEIPPLCIFLCSPQSKSGALHDSLQRASKGELNPSIFQGPVVCGERWSSIRCHRAQLRSSALREDEAHYCFFVQFEPVVTWLHWQQVRTNSLCSSPFLHLPMYLKICDKTKKSINLVWIPSDIMCNTKASWSGNTDSEMEKVSDHRGSPQS